MSAIAASGLPKSTPKIRSSFSDRIRIARAMCIFCMTFVHVPQGVADNVYLRSAGAFDIFYFLMTRIIGLSSVSLLSLVSGYLIVSTYSKLGARQLYASKFKTLVVPLVAWNLVMLALLVVYGILTAKWDNLPDMTPLGLGNALLALTEWPAVVPLWFLRDLFVCVLLAPVVLFGLQRWPLAAMVALLAFTMLGEPLMVLQRPALLLFFGIGMWVRVAGNDEAAIDRMARPFSWGLLVMAVVYLTLRIDRIPIGEMNDSVRISLDILLRITMAAAFWRLTEWVRRSSFAGFCTWLEPYTFFIFCSHAILFEFSGIAFRRVFGNYGDDLFLVTFLTLTMLAVISAVVGLQVIAWSRPLLAAFNAGHGAPPLTHSAGLEPQRA